MTNFKMVAETGKSTALPEKIKKNSVSASQS
jgi:hypothetical protein